MKYFEKAECSAMVGMIWRFSELSVEEDSIPSICISRGYDEKIKIVSTGMSNILMECISWRREG